MRRLVIAPILGTLTLGLVVVAVVVAGVTAAGGAAPGSHPAPAGTAPLSQAAVIHRLFSQPGARQGELAAMIATLRAVASGAAPRATPGAAAGPLAADVFNHDTVGLSQNEESVTVCGQTVLGGTNEVDLDDLPAETRRDLEFILVDSIEQVLDVAFDGARNGAARVGPTAVKQAAKPG